MWFKQFAQAVSAHSVDPEMQNVKLDLKEPDSYAAKRAKSIEMLGDKWLLHPANKVTKLEHVTNILRHRKID